MLASLWEKWQETTKHDIEVDWIDNMLYNDLESDFFFKKVETNDQNWIWVGL